MIQTLKAMGYHKTTHYIAVALMIAVSRSSSQKSNNELRKSNFSEEKSPGQLPQHVEVNRRDTLTANGCYDYVLHCYHYGKSGCSKDVYTGSRERTLFGTDCQYWKLNKYNKFLNMSRNYCRNPDEEDGPWCYTTNPNRKWDFCFIDCNANDCFDSKRGCFHYGKARCNKRYLYTGKRSHTFDGIECQRWSSKGPKYSHLHNNFCRNPDGHESDKKGPWCYATKNVEGKDWDYCFQDCAVDDCYDNKRKCFHYGKKECTNKYLYNGTRSYTFNGIKCQQWNTKGPKYSNLPNNYCRNPDGQKGPWCYAATKILHAPDWDYCLTDCLAYDCYDSNRKCFHYGKAGCTGRYIYNGTIRHTFDGTHCQPWKYMEGQYKYLPENYCTNSDGKRGPWCKATKTIELLMTGDDWDYCFTDCAAEDCLMYNGHSYCYSREEKCQKPYAYNGSRNFNKDGHRCAKWSSVSKYKWVPGSYCRNPNSRVGGPWCYTEGRGSQWNYCYDEDCHVGPCYNISRKCFHYEKPECKKIDSYIGTRSYTLSGLKCAEWSSSPAITDVEKKKLLKNFCRNPRQKEGPWCYTGGSEFDYCLEACTNYKCYDSSRDCFHYRKAGCSNAYSYMGTRSYSVTGHTCEPWSKVPDTPYIAGTLCRDPTGVRKGPYCLINPVHTELDYCFKDCDEGKCYDSEKDCFHGEKPECRAPYAYLGNKGHTTDGTKCQAWLTHGDHSPRNYCRLRFAGNRGPWCYINVNDLKKEFCILDCVQKNIDDGYTCGLYETLTSCRAKAAICHQYPQFRKYGRLFGKCELLKSTWYHCICQSKISRQK